MKKIIRSAAVLLSAIMLLMCFCTNAWAIEGVSINSDVPKNITYATARFSGSPEARSFQMPYSDDLFTMPSNQYSQTLAQASIGLTVASFRDTDSPDSQDDYFIDLAEQLELTNIETDPYHSEPETDSICYGIASKQIADFTLIVVGVSGRGYGKEWASNLTIGTGTRSQGFNEAAQQVELGVYDYIMKYNISGNMKIWISGFSRAAATSNIAAADLTDSGYFSDVYAYCFACPRTTKEPGNYSNIYNIISKDDVVPDLPLADWGFKRYGIDMYYKSAESDSNSRNFTEASAEIYNELTGSSMPLNHDINSELRIVFDYMYMLFPEPEVYVEEFQGLIRSIFNGGEKIEAVSGFISILSQYAENYPDKSDEISELISYVQILANKYFLSGNVEQKQSGAWDSELGKLNFFNEHLPEKYIARIFAYDDPELTFSENTAYLRLVIYGEKLNISIKNASDIVSTISPDGNITNIEGTGIYAVPYAAYYRNKVEITLPQDQVWDIYISSPAKQLISYTCMQFTDESVKAHLTKFYTLNINSNEIYGITTTMDESAIDLDLTDHSDVVSLSDMAYSPSMIMRIENSAIEGITISEVFMVLVFIAGYLVLCFIISIILKIIRKKKKRRRKAIPTILAHLLFIVLFASIENWVWYFVPTIPIIRTVIRVFIFLSLNVLAVRAYRRYKDKDFLHACLVIPAVSIIDLVLENLFVKQCTGFTAYIPIIVYVVLFAASCTIWYMTYRICDKYYLEPEDRSFMDSQL